MLGTSQLQCPRSCRLAIFPSPPTEPLYSEKGLQSVVLHQGTEVFIITQGFPTLFLSQPPPCNNPPREQQGHNLPETRQKQ